ncbi:MAG: GNAT family N-acetyltransferase, partial [Evtepia sp.]|nr:GNAT family N-acetyltransferase [Evtepia sp.]
MMMQVVHPPEQAAPLFAGWEETLLWSCLQGVMGKVYAPAGEPLRAAPAVFGDFTFLAGDTRADLAAFSPPGWRRGYRLL